VTLNLEPGDPVLYMKIGTHAQEDLGSILDRKRREIEEAGFAMWGYGGNTCHPTSMVQPFARAAEKPVILCMQPMQSKHFAEPIRAEQYSIDGTRWQAIPHGINVLGSRYALCISSLEEVDETLDLSGTRVAVGNSRGLSGDRYVRGRVDKACLEVTDLNIDISSDLPTVRKIGVIAKVVEPYAVLLRN
jgi:hypothetical protein